MTATIIPFAEAAQRVRQRLAEPPLDSVDWLWIAAACILPLWLSLLVSISVAESIAEGCSR